MESGKSLLDDLSAPTSETVRSDCGLTKLRLQMSEDEAVALDKAVDMVRQDSGSGRSKVYSSQWLTGVLRKHGYDISASTVSRHVAKRCRCE